jgi:hypothetical protein
MLEKTFANNATESVRRAVYVGWKDVCTMSRLCIANKEGSIFFYARLNTIFCDKQCQLR